MEEDVFYNNGTVAVTKTRVVIGGTTYSVNTISAVKITTGPDYFIQGIILLVLGIILLMAGISLSGFLWLSLICLSFGVYYAFFYKPPHTLVFVTNSGQMGVLKSKDFASVKKVLEAVNQAIDARG